MTIRQRRDGWQVIVYAGLDPLTGKQRQISRQVNGSHRQAEKEERRLMTEVADGRHRGTRAKTLGELVDRWIEWRATNGKPISPHTLDDYRGVIAHKIKPAIGGLRLHKVDPQTLDRLYDELRRRGNAKAEAKARARARAAAATNGEDPGQVVTVQPTEADQRLSGNRVRDVHVILSGALGLAARWGWIPYNPALVARPARGKGAKRLVPTPEQVRELFKAVAEDQEFEVFLRLSATTGLRPGEICALRWVDLDLDRGEMDVNGNIVTAKDLPEKYERKDTKSVHGERRLALDKGTVAALKAHWSRLQSIAEELELDELPADAHGDTYVFPRTVGSGKPIRPDAMGKRFTALVRELGHTYTLYGLRHFMATQLGAVAEAGTVRARMGHGSLAVTSGYMHPVTEADREAARYMDDLLAGRTKWRVEPERATDEDR